MREIGEVFAEKFKDTGITKVVTIEASGIAPALTTGLIFHVPVVFARNNLPITTCNLAKGLFKKFVLTVELKK